MAVSVDSPLGSSSVPFTRSAGVTWDPRYTVPVNIPGNGPLINNNLTMLPTAAGSGVGTIVPIRLSKASGKYYFEATWTGLIGSLLGGIGIISTEALAGVRDLADVASVFGALAADGSNGCIFRPNGTVYETIPNGNAVDESSESWPLFWRSDDGGVNPSSCREGDTLGFLVDFDSYSPEWVAVKIVGVGGSFLGSSGIFFPPAGTYVPCVVFGSISAFDILAVTANFGADPSSLLGPKLSDLIESGAFNGVTLGWPATL